MKFILENNNVFLVEVPANKEIRAEIKDTYKARWNNQIGDYKSGGYLFSKLYMRLILERRLKFIYDDCEIESAVVNHFKPVKADAYKLNLSNHFNNNTFAWQRKIIYLAFFNKTYLLALDTGLGKTVVGLELFWQFLKANPDKKGVIIAPFQTIHNAWLTDVKKLYKGKFSCISTWDTDVAEKLRKIRSEAQLYIMNHDGLNSKYFEELMTRQGSKLDFIIYDESSSLKQKSLDRPGTAIKMLLKYKYNFTYKYLLSGNPAPNTPLEWYPQMQFIDDRILGNIESAYYNYYFHKNPYNSWKYIIDNGELRLGGKLEELMTDIKQKAIFVSKTQVQNLPPQKRVIVNYSLDNRQIKHYNEMNTELRTIIGNRAINTEFALAKAIKLREITRGFIFDNEGTERLISAKPYQELQKLIKLTNIAQETFIIWIDFQFEARVIASLLRKMGITYEIINSTTPQKKQPFIIRDFRAGKFNCLIAHPDSISHGVRLETCHQAIFFSRNYSDDNYQQAEDRIHRFGQEETCIYFIFQALNTIDKNIDDVLRKKRQYSEFSLKMIERQIV